MYQIKKRSGELELFELSKIKSAIKRTFDSCNRNYQESIIETISIKSVADAETKIKDNVLNVEDIQDSVEKVLMTYGYEDVAKAYILYRKQHERVRNAKDTLLNYKNVMESYIDKSDWRVKENSSIDYSLGGLILGNSGAVTANYWLSEIYDEEIANAHRNCDMHIHDLSMLSGYCFTGDTKVAVIRQEFEKYYIESYTNTYDERIDYSEFVSFEDLIKSGRKKPYVIAHTGKEDEFEVVQADDIRVTRYVDEVIELTFHTLCYGDVTIKSTLDHPYLVEKVSSSGSEYSYVKASELCENDNVVGLEYDIGGGYNEYHVQLKESKIVKLDKSIPVYDLTVPKYHNFLIEGDIFVHNCAGWSLKTLIKEGFGGVPRKISSAPAKHLSTLCNQMINFLGTMSLEWSGAQAFNSVDTLLAPFVKVDNMSYKEVKQCIQSLVFGLNVSSRWGSQPVFSNFTFDWTVPNDLAELNCIVGGEEQDFRYKDCERELNMINRAFIETMIDGDSEGRSFAYPIPTYSITKDFDWDTESPNNKLLFEMTAKYGIPYFSNYINSDLQPDSVRAMCPLHGDEFVLIRDKFSKEFHLSRIGNLYKCNNTDYIYDIILNGSIKQARLNRFDNLDFYTIETANGYSVTLSSNHLNLVLGNEVKQTKDLTEDDYLPFNISVLTGTGLCYDDGFIVGAYLGDGSLKDDYSVVFSLNNTTKSEAMSKIMNIALNKFGAKIKTDIVTSGVGNNGCVNLTITSKYMRGLIEEYVSGKALDKDINVKAITRSVEFRKGIIDGYQNTDGGVKNRIYSASENAIRSITTIFESLGIPCKVSADSGLRDGRLSSNTIYCIRPYDMNYNKSGYKNVFIKKDEYMWFKITKITKLDSKSHVGYCFEVLNDDEPYFMLPSGLVTHNCRLRLDLRELRRKSGGYFGSGDNTGSIGVVTINMPRLAYTSKTKDEFYSRLTKLMDIAARSLKIKRNVITQYLEQGLYPYTKRYLGSFNDHFSTIGIVGMNECCMNANWIKDSIVSSEGYNFTKEVLDFMRNKLSDYQEQYGDLYNYEATPAEGVTHRFASHDKKDFPDIITAGDKTEGAPYYTNSSHLPVGYTDDIFEALDHQDDLQTKYTSGTVFHAFLGEKLPSWQAAMNLTRKIAENYKLPYFTFSPTYSICQEHGYLVGEQWKCPHCGKDTEVYSRVTGYYRAVQNFNDGKAHEFKDRKEYTNFSREFKSTQVQAEEQEVNEPEDIKLERPILFTTSTCPNCKIVKQLLAEYDFVYDLVVADQDMETARKFDINQAPTLVVQDEEGNLIKIANVSNIKKFIEEAMADIEE